MREKSGMIGGRLWLRVDRREEYGNNESMLRTIIYLLRDKLEVYRVENGEKTVTAETSWDETTLSSKLEMVRIKFETESVRVLIAKEISGSEMILDTLSKAALKARLKIEMVEDESLIETESDQVLGLASKEGVSELPSTPSGMMESGVGEMIPPEEKGERKGSWRLVLIGLGVILVIAVVVGGVLRARSAKQVQQAEEVVVEMTPTPTPTPEPVELSMLSVQIQNGSGVAGEAGVVSKILIAEGFESEMIEAGNAESFDYTKTEVQVKEGLSEEVYQIVEQALSPDYEVKRGESLDADADYDVVVIVGERVEE